MIEHGNELPESRPPGWSSWRSLEEFRQYPLDYIWANGLIQSVLSFLSLVVSVEIYKRLPAHDVHEERIVYLVVFSWLAFALVLLLAVGILRLLKITNVKARPFVRKASGMHVAALIIGALVAMQTAATDDPLSLKEIAPLWLLKEVDPFWMKAAIWLVDAVMVGAILRIDWRYHWPTVRRRLKVLLWDIATNYIYPSLVLISLVYLSITFGSYHGNIWQQALWWFALLPGSVLALWCAAFVVRVLYEILSGQDESLSREAVQNQKVHGGRHRIGDEVKILDPFGVLKAEVEKAPAQYQDLIDLGLVESCGFNPLAALDPASPRFYDDAAVIAGALIKVPLHNDPHWAESAQGLVAGLLMWERIHRGKRAELGNVRTLLTEADAYEGEGDEAELVRGLRATARAMVKRGKSKDGKGFEIASLAGRFAAEKGNDEIDSIRSSADTQTSWLLSRPMRADLKKNGVDFRELKTKPMTVYVIVPADLLEDHSVWLRLVISEALRASMTTGGRRVLLMLDEFAALGHLAIVQKLWGVTRDYRVQMMPVFQDLPQLKQLYAERWETILGMAGVVQSFRAGDLTTSDWNSKRSPTTTAVSLGYNKGDGSTRGEHNKSQSTNSGLSYNQIERPTIRPNDMFGLPDELTITWFAGKKNPTMLYMPHLEQLTRLKALALPNPYYHG